MEVLLVGLGNMGLKYLRKLEELKIPIFINDINEGKAESLPYPFLPSIEDLPGTITHAIVAVDPKDHVNIANALLSRDIKVLLEKPPALSSEEFLKIKDAENLYISEIELYNPCLLNMKGQVPTDVKIFSKRLNRGIGYFSPLWDLAWHDLYIIDYLFGEISVFKCSGQGFYRKLEGKAGTTEFVIEVAWKYDGNVDRSLRVGEYLINFVEGTVYKGSLKICENIKDKLKLMVNSFLDGTYIGGSRERAYRIIKELEKINDFTLG